MKYAITYSAGADRDHRFRLAPDDGEEPARPVYGECAEALAASVMPDETTDNRVRFAFNLVLDDCGDCSARAGKVKRGFR